MKMKKIVALLLSGVMLSSIVFSGCAQSDLRYMSETETETGTESTVTAEPEKPQINKDNYAKVEALLNSSDSKSIQVFADGIRGGAEFYVSSSSGRNIFCYTSLNKDSIQLSFDSEGSTVEVTVDMYYHQDETRFFATSKPVEVGICEIESYIDDMIANKTDVFDAPEDSALIWHKYEIREDLPIYYSRLITCAGKAFSEIGLSLEDLGLDLGDKYRSVDPTQPTSTEHIAKNEYKFVNGICTDSNMKWTSYMYQNLAKFDYRYKDSTSHIILGQRSSAMFDSCNDYVEVSAPNTDMIQFQYTNAKSVDMVDYVESCYIIVENYSGKETVSMMFELNMKNRPKSGIPTDYKFRYFVEINAAPGEFDKVFESKETFKNSAKVEVIMALDDGSLKSEEITDEPYEVLKPVFDKEGCIYYSKDEILDKFWDDHVTFFTSIDNGIIWFDTSLADAGINWK